MWLAIRHGPRRAPPPGIHGRPAGAAGSRADHPLHHPAAGATMALRVRGNGTARDARSAAADGRHRVDDRTAAPRATGAAGCAPRGQRAELAHDARPHHRHHPVSDARGRGQDVASIRRPSPPSWSGGSRGPGRSTSRPRTTAGAGPRSPVRRPRSSATPRSPRHRHRARPATSGRMQESSPGQRHDEAAHQQDRRDRCPDAALAGALGDDGRGRPPRRPPRPRSTGERLAGAGTARPAAESTMSASGLDGSPAPGPRRASPAGSSRRSRPSHRRPTAPRGPARDLEPHDVPRGTRGRRRWRPPRSGPSSARPAKELFGRRRDVPSIGSCSGRSPNCVSASATVPARSYRPPGPDGGHVEGAHAHGRAVRAVPRPVAVHLTAEMEAHAADSRSGNGWSRRCGRSRRSHAGGMRVPAMLTAQARKAGARARRRGRSAVS